MTETPFFLNANACKGQSLDPQGTHAVDN